MSDIYVQYEATVSVTHSIWRIIVKVPRGKIDQYRIDHGDQSSDDTAIARKLSEEPAKKTPYLAQLSSYSLGVSYSDHLAQDPDQKKLSGKHFPRLIHFLDLRIPEDLSWSVD